MGFDTGLGELEQKILHDEVVVTATKGKIMDYPVKQEYLEFQDDKHSVHVN